MRRKSESFVQSSDEPPSFDVLDDVLRGLQLRSRDHGRYELRAPWGLEMDRASFPVFYAVMRGQCVLTIDGGDHVLAEGDFAFVAPDRGFTLRDRRQTPALPLQDVYAARGLRCGGVLSYGGSGVETILVVGSFAFEHTTPRPLAYRLPILLYVNKPGTSRARWLESTLDLVATEVAERRPGYETTVSRLADVLFVEAVRAHMESRSSDRGWLRALDDPRLGPVLRRIHETPEEAWTLRSLSRVAGMSRSVFAARFKEVVGDAPLAYLGKWRMHRAVQLMDDRQLSLAEIGRRVGYETESAFGKAFKRSVGMTPGRYRREREHR